MMQSSFSRPGSLFKWIMTVLACYAVIALMISGLPPRYTLGFLLSLIVIPVFFMNLSAFLIGLFLIRPTIDGFLTSIRFSVSGVDLGLGGCVALTLILATVIRLLIIPDGFKKLHHPMIRLYLLFCLVNMGVIFYSIDMASSLKTVVRYFSILSVMILCATHVTSFRQSRVLVKSMLWSSAAPIIVGIVYYLIEGGRFSSTFSHPNIFAFYLLVLIGCLLFQLDNRFSHSHLSLSRLCVFMFLIVLLGLTETRSAWTAGLLMFLIYTLFFNRKMFLPGMVVLTILMLTPFAQEKIHNIFHQYGQSVAIHEYSSLGWRLETWRDLFTFVMKRPIFGYGIGADYLFVREGLAAHNDYLRYLLESGIIGLFVFLCPYLYLIMSCVRNLKQYSPSDRIYKWFGFFICFIPAFLLMSITENLASYATIHWYIWGLIGIYVGLLHRERRTSK